MKKFFKILKKTLKIIGITLALIIGFILLMPFVCYDISKEKLGPSPFRADETITSEDNEEFKKLLEIGKEIQGYKEFNEAYELDLNNPQPSILLLQEYLKKNEGIIEKIDFDLYKNCKFPKPDLGPNAQDYDGLRKILKLLQWRTTLRILTNDYEKAKSDLILSNQINLELFKKINGVISSLAVFSLKRGELDNINLILNLDEYSLDQKLEVLNLKQEVLTSQILRNIVHFECDAKMRLIQELKTPNDRNSIPIGEAKYFPVITPFLHQPNKTGKLYREMASKVISDFENHGKNSSPHTMLNEYIGFHLKALFGNYVGIIAVVDNAKPFTCLMSSKILDVNCKLAQLSVAKQLLIYKKENGALPKSLSDLKIEKKLYTFTETGESFLYYAPNGILQNEPTVYGIEIQELTTKELTTEKIKSTVKANLMKSRYFIICLK